MSITETSDYIMPQTVVAAPIVMEVNESAADSPDEPIAPPGKLSDKCIMLTANHHAFPTSARHGLSWWQFDASWLIIQAMEKMKLAWNIRVPAPEVIDEKRLL